MVNWMIESISSSPQVAFEYALSSGCRVPEVETAIMTNRVLAFEYARSIMEGSWPEYEKFLIHFASPQILVDYVCDVINDRWPEAERLILKDEWSVFRYIQRVSQRRLGWRWEAGEQVLMKSPKWAYFYAKDVLGRQWEEAEPCILADPHYDPLYRSHFGLTSLWSSVY